MCQYYLVTMPILSDWRQGRQATVGLEHMKPQSDQRDAMRYDVIPSWALHWDHCL
jgi:hypothetical protein